MPNLADEFLHTVNYLIRFTREDFDLDKELERFEAELEAIAKEDAEAVRRVFEREPIERKE